MLQQGRQAAPEHHGHDVDPDLADGVAELQRVARRQVVFLFEPSVTGGFWAIEYWPEALEVPTERDAPGVDRLRQLLDVREVRPVPVPLDCTDGFGAAYADLLRARAAQLRGRRQRRLGRLIGLAGA